MTDPILTSGLDPEDKRSHVERINPGDNPAAAPGGGGLASGPVPDERGEKKLYQLLTKGAHHGFLYQPGETVWLHDDEVGPQHQPVVTAEMKAAAAAAAAKAARAAKVAEAKAKAAAEAQAEADAKAAADAAAEAEAKAAAEAGDKTE
jgi:nucleoid-associated protein YgaU